MLVKIPWILVLLYFSIFDLLQNREIIIGHTNENDCAMAEMCDNGIDDDGNGLIDLNDPSCTCEPIVNFYIPNPSFEDTLCCPCAILTSGSCVGIGQLGCLDSWLNSSVAGADLFHLCADYSGQIGALPYNQVIENTANGEAYVGFGNSIAVKEYIGVCLDTPLNAGELYQFEIDIGFSDGVELDFGLFGTDNCNNWPFNRGQTTFGCPKNNVTWIELGTSKVLDTNSWKRITIQFTPSTNIAMLGIGSSCAFQAPGAFTYHFIDDLTLFSLADNNVNITIVSNGGNACAGNADLSFPQPNIPSRYQWYNDGVALVGETGSVYSLPGGMASDGTYLVKIINAKGCFLTNPFPFSVAPLIFIDTVTICEGGSWFFDNQNLLIAGDYVDTLPSQFNCDSIVLLNLRVSPVQNVALTPFTFCEGNQPPEFPVTGLYRDTIHASNCDSIINVRQVTILPLPFSPSLTKSICEGEIYFIGTNQFTSTGNYAPVLLGQGANGCDSTVLLNLTVIQLVQNPITLSRCEGENIFYNGDELIGNGPFEYHFATPQGCDSIVIIVVIDLPDPVEVDPVIYEVNLGDSVTISVDVDLGATISSTWLPNPTINLSTDLIQTIFPVVSTTLQLETIDTSGCIWLDFVEINVISDFSIFFPTGFTPGMSQNINDVFRPYIKSDVGAILHFSVYNRWGDALYIMPGITLAESINDDMGWDGIVSRSGENAPTGVYIYYCKAVFLDGVEREFAGDVTLIR